MSLPMHARFGLNSGPLELDGREVMLIVNALNRQRLYSEHLAQTAKQDEAIGRNKVNALELKVLMEKIEAAAGR